MASDTLNGRRSTFEKIEEISRVLLEKGTIGRFVDKGVDSGVVARLVERLQQAIVSYQVSGDYTPVLGPIDQEGQISQQQAIYRQIAHLTVRLLRSVVGTGTDPSRKSSFDTLLRLQEVVYHSGVVAALAHG